MAGSPRPSRRWFLRSLGAAASSVGLAGCSGLDPLDDAGSSTPSPTLPTDRPGRTATRDVPTDFAPEFDATVDVTDYGADPTGGSPIDDALARAIEPGTLVRFPAGTYQLGRTIELTDDRVGLVGEGARLVLPEGHSGRFLFARGAAGVLFRGFTVDMRGDRTGHAQLDSSGFHVEDVRYLGRGGLTGYAFSVAVTDPDGRGVLRRVRVPRGGYIDRYDDAAGEAGNGRIGVWAGIDHVGTLRVENCDFREFGNNGLYTSRCPGNVQVVDSYFENNNVCSIRISGKGSYAENCEVLVDHSRYEPRLTSTESGFNTRGIIVEQGKGMTADEFPAKPAGAEIRNCRVRALQVHGEGNIQSVVEQGPQARTLTIRDTEIRVDVDGVPAVRRGRPGAIRWRTDRRTVPGPHWTRLENVTITGSATGGSAVFLDRASGSEIRDCTIEQPGEDRDGIVVRNSGDVLLTGGRIRTGAFPLALRVDPTSVRGRCILSVDEVPTLETVGVTDARVGIISPLSGTGGGSRSGGSGSGGSGSGSGSPRCVWADGAFTPTEGDGVDVGIVGISGTGGGLQLRGRIRVE